MISGAELRDAFISAAHNISNYKESVDALNIFPVPDGDTGTNMSRTMNSTLNCLAEMDDEIAASEVASRVASALLRGARGNSGAITSLIFRGFADGLRGCREINGVVIATALSMASENAYKSVMSPTEGTILTVIRLAAESAKQASGINVDTVDVFDAAVDGAKKALKRTPELLSILKRAKVVDAGGQGLVYILEAMQSVFRNHIIVEAKESADTANTIVANDVTTDEEIKFTYCTELLIDKTHKTTAMDIIMFKGLLEGMGDCVVVADDDEIIKLHVHTNDPGEVITNALNYGDLNNIKVENMRLQHKNASWGTNSGKKIGEEAEIAESIKDYGFVAIGAGNGMNAMFAQLGVDKVVSGGQTMNPSTEDILTAINKTPADTVFVLPNNKNIILTAKQTVDLTPKKVVVIETRSIPEGVGALIAFDPSQDIETNRDAMTEAFKEIQTASVTFAARDSSVAGVAINEGDIMGLENGKVTIVDTDPNNAAYRCVKHLAKRNTSMITIYYGEGMTETAAYKLREQIIAKLGDDVEISVIYGGQPVYYYIIGVE